MTTLPARESGRRRAEIEPVARVEADGASARREEGGRGHRVCGGSGGARTLLRFTDPAGWKGQEM